MKRIEHIRQNLVAKLISSEGWWQEDSREIEKCDSDKNPSIHHSAYPRGMKNRRIIERLMALTSRESDKDRLW